MKKLLLSTLLAACGSPIQAPNAPTFASNEAAVVPPPAEIIPQDSQAMKALYASLAQEWSQWALEQPFSQSVLTDTTGERCATNQPNDVFFLAGTTGGAVNRACAVPAGTPIFFPVINWWCLAEAENYDTRLNRDVWLHDATVVWKAENQASNCRLTLKIDGQDVFADTAAAKAAMFTAQDKPFSVWLDDDNWATQYGKAGGLSPVTIAAGYFALLPPLSVGAHTIEFGGGVCDQGAEVWSVSATYALDIQ